MKDSPANAGAVQSGGASPADAGQKPGMTAQKGHPTVYGGIMLRMRIQRRLMGVLACVLPVAAASLPTAKPEEVGISSERLGRIHEMLARHIAAHDISGAVTMVARRGKVVHFEAHGLMGIEANKPMTKDAIFRLASSSKPITATAILMLMEEGKLKLTDPVSKYIPEFRNSKVAVETVRAEIPMADQQPAGERYHTVPANHDVTIIDLLTHTSGLASSGITNADFQKLLQARQPTDTLADFIPRLGALPLDFQPWVAVAQYSGLAGFEHHCWDGLWKWFPG